MRTEREGSLSGSKERCKIKCRKKRTCYAGRRDGIVSAIKLSAEGTVSVIVAPKVQIITQTTLIMMMKRMVSLLHTTTMNRMTAMTQEK